MIIIIMGVTGSGKTTIGKLLADDLNWRYCDADDFHSAANVAKMKSGIPLDDADRQPWLQSLRNVTQNCLESGDGLVLACSALKQSYRDVLLIDERVKLVFLKGDYELIGKRLNERQGHYMNPALLDSQFATLEEPKGHAEFDVAASPAEIVRNIRRLLRL